MLQSFFGSISRYLVLTVTVLAVLSEFARRSSSEPSHHRICRLVAASVLGPHGLHRSGTESSLTLWWRRQSRANSSLNSLLTGKIQGISSNLGPITPTRRQKPHLYQRLTGKLPYAGITGNLCS